MHLPASALLILSSVLSVALAAPRWSFTDASLSLQKKGNTGSGAFRISPSAVHDKPIQLGPADTLKISLTVTDGKTPKRPQQAFLMLADASGRLDTQLPFLVKESGKGTLSLVSGSLPAHDAEGPLELQPAKSVPFTLRADSPFLQTQKDIPSALLTNNTLSASLILASSGTSQGYNHLAFYLTPNSDPDTPFPKPESPLRYGKLEEIHHVFRDDPKSPNILISVVFLGGVLATIPILFGAVGFPLASHFPQSTSPIRRCVLTFVQWLYLGANLNHLPSAFQTSPISHGAFLGSIAGIEFVLFLYYTSWNLFQTLPVLGVLGTVAFLSGSRALGEVQDRRLAGKR
jgi:oligosaccharyltransferase complex subunit delta (ribophorin II)